MTRFQFPNSNQMGQPCCDVQSPVVIYARFLINVNQGLKTKIR